MFKQIGSAVVTPEVTTALATDLNHKFITSVTGLLPSGVELMLIPMSSISWTIGTGIILKQLSGTDLRNASDHYYQ
jgi:hypothetical protein